MPRNPEIEAGILDRRVSILKPVYNEFQDEITGWEPIGSCWAGIAPLFGSEQNEAGHTVATTQHQITIRFRRDIDKRFRLLDGGRTYQIEAILDIQRRQAQLLLTCKEVE
jgi:SPP1 family predicted phage head-tail adaptor